MTSIMLSRLALACACSTTWTQQWAPSLYRASALAELVERRVFEAPAVALAWTFVIVGAVFMAIACMLVWMGCELLPKCEGEPGTTEDRKA